MNRRRAGFTLVEIMLVVVIIGVIAALFVPNLIGRSDQARRTAAMTDLRSVGATLDMYRLDNAHYPSTDQGLEALVNEPSGLPEPMNYTPGGYARKVPTDPWQNPYVYINAGDTFELYSLGADGKEGGEGSAADIHYRDL
ncbi:MAG: type II secretion system major pseudopilin GspG [Gammaproteobacteria bacterium]|nr:type II secretion system major pseudopilin GspG [Gammaproteobacteria bacterium]MDE0225744.1 type II secretion system major pseudopilin GspG [Gammaproteobacteria bacterium]MDE0453533.1 type II secretion system major pseudopilin GspG [Gammaproteobacteria bacterium]